MQLAIANTLWLQVGHPFLDEFVALVRSHHGEAVAFVDYGDAEAARATINDWVANATSGKITGPVPVGAFDEPTRLALVNAICFKGTWEEKFNARATKQEDFRSSTGPIRAATMHRTDFFGYAEAESLQVLRLP